MSRFILGRLLLIPIILLVVNFAAFAYARPAQIALNSARISPREGVKPINPFEEARRFPLIEPYKEYLIKAISLDFGTFDRGRGSVVDEVGRAARASGGLLAITYLMSTIVGLIIGLRAVRVEPPGPASWLLPFSSIGLSLPSFFIGSVALGTMLIMIARGWGQNPFPFGGFGWDRHLALPVFCLALRPTAQIAQLASRLMGEELGRQYVVAARAVGFGWTRIRGRTALHPVAAPLLLGIGNAFRLTLGDLLIVEQLFRWNGLGQRVVEQLFDPTPPLLATYLTIFAAFYLVVDFFISLMARMSDPRLQSASRSHTNG